MDKEQNIQCPIDTSCITLSHFFIAWLINVSLLCRLCVIIDKKWFSLQALLTRNKQAGSSDELEYLGSSFLESPETTSTVIASVVVGTVQETKVSVFQTRLLIARMVNISLHINKHIEKTSPGN